MLWTYERQRQPRHGQIGTEVVRYAAAKDRTVIDYSDETLFIDYRQLRLYRYRKLDQICVVFPLQTSTSHLRKFMDKSENNRQKLSALLGSIKVIPLDETRTIKGYPCRKKQVLMASDLAFSQMVVSPVIEEFGRKFSEAMGMYWVSSDVAGLDVLMEIARSHQAVFVANPLLRQIDMVGLFNALHGFPVRIEAEAQRNGYEDTLISISPLTGNEKLLEIPQACLKIIP